MKYEELFLLKQMLCQYAGSDPVMLKLPDLTGEVKILASSIFWVNSSNDLVNSLHKGFGNKVGVSIKSMDTDLKDGDVAIKRDKSKTTLTLITCTKGDKTTQTIYICERI